MTDEELAAIQARLDGWQYGTLTITSAGERTTEAYNARHAAPGDIRRLLAEVERLRAELHMEQFDNGMHQIAADSEIKRLREIVQAVAVQLQAPCYSDEVGLWMCPLCDGEARNKRDFAHEPDCPITKASALLGKENA